MTTQRKKAPASAFPHLTECHSPESKQPLHCGPGIAARQASACAATLDSISTVAKNAGVAFNSATEIGVSNPVADSRLHAAFFTSVNNTIGASLLWRAVVGECLHSPVSTGPVRQSRHVPATPDWRREAGLYHTWRPSCPSLSAVPCAPCSRLLPFPFPPCRRKPKPTRWPRCWYRKAAVPASSPAPKVSP